MRSVLIAGLAAVTAGLAGSAATQAVGAGPDSNFGAPLTCPLGFNAKPDRSFPMMFVPPEVSYTIMWTNLTGGKPSCHYYQQPSGALSSDDVQFLRMDSKAANCQPLDPSQWTMENGALYCSHDRNCAFVCR